MIAKTPDREAGDWAIPKGLGSGMLTWDTAQRAPSLSPRELWRQLPQAGDCENDRGSAELPARLHSQTRVFRAQGHAGQPC